MHRLILLLLHAMSRRIPLWIDSFWLSIQHVSTHASHRSTHPESHTLMYRHILSSCRLILSLVLIMHRHILSSCRLILSLVLIMHRRKPSMDRLILSLTSPMYRLIQLEVDTYWPFLHNYVFSSVFSLWEFILQPYKPYYDHDNSSLNINL